MVGGAIVYLNDWKDNQMSDDDEMLCPLDLGDIEMKPPSKKKRSKASGGDSVKVNTMLIDNSIPAPPISTPPRSRTAFSKSKNTSEFDELPTAQVLLQFCMEMSNLSNTVVGWIVSAAPLCMGFFDCKIIGRCREFGRSNAKCWCVRCSLLDWNAHTRDRCTTSTTSLLHRT
eukprot:GHVT01074723.1.p1 GENE.GHVT01074723.1~~GHVT01074723.1.p1  ORF type:complete len:172 (+),score=1.34 GHVT01074723.1:113-628(+)